MEKVKKFFNIKEKYKFELGDFYAITFLINVILIMTIGMVASWFGLAIAIIGLFIDFCTDRHINNIVSHLSSIILNIYFLVAFA